MTTLAATEIVLELGGHRLLDGVEFRLSRGEMVGLIGPNGAGKTSLLRSLLGLVTLTAGRITLDDIPVRSLSRRHKAQRLAYLPQHPASHWAVSVRDLVSLGRIPFQYQWRAPADDDDRAIDAAMTAMDVAHLADRSVTTLSGGEQIRAQLARALSGDPELLLTDEPVAALDPFHQLQVMELLRERAHCGFGVLVVLHDLSLAARFCDRLVLLDAGRKVADGPPAEVLDAPHLQTVFRIRAVAQQHDGVPYIIPWSRVE